MPHFSYQMNKVAILGAGVMGARIAAHLANAGIRSYLLDIVPNKLTEEEGKKGLSLSHPEVRNRYAKQGLQTAIKSKPAIWTNVVPGLRIIRTRPISRPVNTSGIGWGTLNRSAIFAIATPTIKMPAIRTRSVVESSPDSITKNQISATISAHSFT